MFIGNKVGDKVIEGKTKIVYLLSDDPSKVLLHSKDRITAGDGERAHDLKGKAEISTTTAKAIFELLNKAGLLLAEIIHVQISFLDAGTLLKK